MTPDGVTPDRRRRVATVRGIVQGVGFRPAVARLADALGLAGAVRNDGGVVVVEVEGPEERVRAFAERLPTSLPAAARVDDVRWEDAAPTGADGFVIADSASGRVRVAIPPDLRTCAECFAEVDDPAARRHGYPFTNCTACGPRFTIVHGLPYDRPRTSMAPFAMCADCAREYADPRDRRYHAQPIACPACGPRLDGTIEAVALRLRAGEAVAIRGLGGYQVLCDATGPTAVLALRVAKRRRSKPFAVLVADLDVARGYAEVDDVEAAALAGPAGPIVLLRPRPGTDLDPEVAPDVGRIGLMLPTTPLHAAIAKAVGRPLVCTSGNRGDEPIATSADDARERLRGLVTGWLHHDREIVRRCDDAVVHVVDGRARTLRLGRGLAPATVPLPPGPDLVAVGGHLKCAPAAAFGDEAVLWPHVGDLDHPLAREALASSVDALRAFLGLDPAYVVHDAHPDYASTRLAASLARDLGKPTMAVWHHHAHVAACLAEHGESAALGIAWDGVGLGEDRAAWGGEVLRVTPKGARRAGWLRPFAIPGGDEAARDGIRCAVGVLIACEIDVPRALAGHANVVRHGLAPTTTSAGRLFDAVAALLHVRERSDYEGHAAAHLEAVCADGDVPPYPFELDGPVLDWRPAVHAMLASGDDVPTMAARFHETLAAMIEAVVTREGAPVVALSGGCFQNVRLTRATLARLRARGVRALLPSIAPPGDGGLALGQLWVARHRHGVR